LRQLAHRGEHLPLFRADMEIHRRWRPSAVVLPRSVGAGHGGEQDGCRIHAAWPHGVSCQSARKGGTTRMTDPVIGTGDYRYRFQRDWAKLLRWWNFGETDLPGPPRTSVKGATAANGDIYVLCRSAHPVLVFDPEGRFVTSWGEGEFSSFVHGITI